MLSQDSLENLAEPILQRQEQINREILFIIARRLGEIGELLPSDVYKLERLLKTGSDVRKINSLLAKLTRLSERDIQSLIKRIAYDSYMDTKPYFDYRKKPFIPFLKNKPLQRVVSAIAKLTSNIFKNIARASAFMVRDRNGNLVPTEAAKAYQEVVDKAVQAVQQGTSTYKEEIRKSLRDLIDNGVVVQRPETGEQVVEYETKTGRRYTQRADAAARRNVLDGIRAVNQEVQDQTGKEFGSDGKEITVHRYSAPDHEPIQGHQFTNEQWERLQSQQPFHDIQGRTFGAIERAIGTWNCRHYTYSIIVGVSKPNFTDEQLEQYKKENAMGYTTPDGKHYTMYECTQRQRQMELAVRKYKDGQMAAEMAQDRELAEEYSRKIVRKMNEYNEFSKECGLKPRFDKMRVDGWKKLK